MKKARIFDVPIDLLSDKELIGEIVNPSSEKEKTIIGNVNIKALNLAHENDRFKIFLQRCDLVYIDGFGPLWGAKLLGFPYRSKYRNTCPDFIDQLFNDLKENKRKIYILAGRQQVVERFKKIMARKHSSLRFKIHHGYFSKRGQENEKVIKDINQFRPDILFVGFGMPLQEFWISDNMHKIDAKVFLPEGACLDFYTNSVARGPDILTDNGLEWLSRLLTEPQRLWKRYLIGNPKFLYRVIKEKYNR